MKLFNITLALLMMTLYVSCGKDNKSGTSNNGNYNNALCANAYTCQNNQLTGLGTSYNGVSIQTVVQQNYCITGSQSRLQYTTQIALPYIVQTGDVYVGVTSYGDVALVVGNGTNSATFSAYLCARSSYQGVVQPVSAPSNIALGVATTCRFKTLFKANLPFSDGSYALFRFLDGGNSQGQKFSICQ